MGRVILVVIMTLITTMAVCRIVSFLIIYYIAIEIYFSWTILFCISESEDELRVIFQILFVDPFDIRIKCDPCRKPMFIVYSRN